MKADDPYSRVDYRRLIGWPDRIRRESPLLRKILGSAPSRRVLDLGCGTGEHARFLATEGFTVLGIDASETMIAKARDRPLLPGLRFELGDLTRIAETTRERFGAAICLGNTLPHLTGDDDLSAFARGVARRLLPGAPLLVQILNYGRIFDRQERYLPLNFRPESEGEIVFLRLMQPRDGGCVLFFPTTLRLRPEAEVPVEVVSARRVNLRGWRPAELEEALATGGFGEQRALGGFDEQPFDPANSRDLVLIARRSPPRGRGRGQRVVSS